MNLHNSKFYTRIDLRQAFNQIPVSEKSKPMTAFRVKDGHYQYTTAPFGLKTMPSVFQRLMTQTFAEIKQKVRVDVYLDIYFSITKNYEILVQLLETIPFLEKKLSKKSYILSDISYE